MSDDKRGAPTREAVEAMIARLDHLIAVRPVMQWGGVNSIVITVGDAKEAAAMLRSLLDAADAPVPRQPTGLQDEIRAAINRYSAESESNTPDWILADFLMGALDAFDGSIRQRERWYGRNPNASPAAPAESAIAPLAEPIAAIAPDALPPGYTSIGDYIAELERDPEAAKILDGARVDVLRRWVHSLAAENAAMRAATGDEDQCRRMMISDLAAQNAEQGRRLAAVERERDEVASKATRFLEVAYNKNGVKFTDIYPSLLVDFAARKPNAAQDADGDTA